ncbi:hypothetical protein PENTCL1PPCAC_6961, partial [Pristionchus entomophagus]
FLSSLFILRHSTSLTFFLLFLLLLLFLLDVAITKKSARLTEVRVVNECPLNVKLRCQSVLTDGKDRFVGPGQASQLVFHDFLLGNRHFWCDVYALNQFDETFDIYGGGRGKKGNVTWLIRPDGPRLQDLATRTRDLPPLANQTHIDIQL